jgi:hypothetical protein
MLLNVDSLKLTKHEDNTEMKFVQILDVVAVVKCEWCGKQKENDLNAADANYLGRM